MDRWNSSPEKQRDFIKLMFSLCMRREPTGREIDILHRGVTNGDFKLEDVGRICGMTPEYFSKQTGTPEIGLN